MLAKCFIERTFLNKNEFDKGSVFSSGFSVSVYACAGWLREGEVGPGGY